jgi:hypothetical protein
MKKGKIIIWQFLSGQRQHLSLTRSAVRYFFMIIMTELLWSKIHIYFLMFGKYSQLFGT